MASTGKSMACMILIATAIAGDADDVFAQGRGFGGQLVRGLLSGPATSSDGSGVRSQPRTSPQRSLSLSPGGLTVGGEKSSVAVSLAPGGVGVAVGTDDTAVAVAVGGGGVGVGVANDRGTAVSVGAGGGGIAVGVVPGEPPYRPFGAPAASGLGQPAAGQSGLASQPFGGSGSGGSSRSRFGGGSYWSFSEN